MHPCTTLATMQRNNTTRTRISANRTGAAATKRRPNTTTKPPHSTTFSDFIRSVPDQWNNTLPPLEPGTDHKHNNVHTDKPRPDDDDTYVIRQQHSQPLQYYKPRIPPPTFNGSQQRWTQFKRVFTSWLLQNEPLVYNLLHHATGEATANHHHTPTKYKQEEPRHR